MKKIEAPGKSLGQLEAEISESMIKFELEYMGRGPKRTRTHILDDMIVIRLEGVLTPAELQLAKDDQGIRLLKEVRTNLIEQAGEILKALIQGIMGRPVLSIHSDISSKRGERIIIFVLDK